MLDWRISNNPTRKNIGAATKTLIRPRLWSPRAQYAGHEDWVEEKAIPDMEAGRKIAMIAYWGSDAVGSIVYQRHRMFSNLAEVKSIAVEPEARGRHAASFLLRQVEREAPRDFKGVVGIVGDTKLANTAMQNFVITQGWRPLTVGVLDSSYAHDGLPDVVLGKQLAAPQ